MRTRTRGRSQGQGRYPSRSRGRFQGEGGEKGELGGSGRKGRGGEKGGGEEEEKEDTGEKGERWRRGKKAEAALTAVSNGIAIHLLRRSEILRRRGVRAMVSQIRWRKSSVQMICRGFNWSSLPGSIRQLPSRQRMRDTSKCQSTTGASRGAARSFALSPMIVKLPSKCSSRNDVKKASGLRLYSRKCTTIVVVFMPPGLCLAMRTCLSSILSASCELSSRI